MSDGMDFFNKLKGSFFGEDICEKDVISDLCEDDYFKQNEVDMRYVTRHIRSARKELERERLKKEKENAT
jgi:hypothetical protein